MVALASAVPNMLPPQRCLVSRVRGIEVKREVQEKGWRKARGGSESSRGGGVRAAGEEEEEDRCALLCSTDVETYSVSVEGKRKFADRQVGPNAACVQLSLHIELTALRSKIRMRRMVGFFSLAFSTNNKSSKDL